MLRFGHGGAFMALTKCQSGNAGLCGLSEVVRKILQSGLPFRRRHPVIELQTVQAGLALLALDQASEQHRCYRVRDVACCVDLAPGHPLLREEPASIVRRDSVVGLS